MTVDRFWLNGYPQGVKSDIVDSDETLNDFFNAACTKYSNNSALKCHGYALDFAKTKEYVANLANSLLMMGIRHGDRVAIVLPNVIQYPLCIFAVLQIGAVVVNINPLYTEHEIDYILENSGAKTVITLDLIASKFDQLYVKHQLKNMIVTGIADIYPTFKRLAMNFVIKYVKRMKTTYSYPAVRLCKLLLNLRLPSSNENNVCANDLAFLQYTSATTGKPKGVELRHANIVANIKQINLWLNPQMDNLDKQVVINALPLYHIFSLTANLLTFFFLGSENVMIINPRNIDDVVKVLRKSQFTVFNALDTLFSHLLDSKKFCQLNFANYKYSIAGGMPLRKIVALKWFKTTGVMPINCYGLTEASPAVTLNPLNNKYESSVGYPMPSTLVAIRDLETHKPMALGEIGVVWVKGPQVATGYWQNAEATKEAFDANGWFNTKDLGFFDEQGRLTLNGRQSEMIIVSGFNVYPAEVEDAISSFSGVKEVGVVGTSHMATGERVVAFIVADKMIDKDKLIKHCHKLIASYKVPQQIIMLDEMPKTLIGKIDKKALIQKI